MTIDHNVSPVAASAPVREGWAAGSFPPRIMTLLRDVADREPKENFGAWEDGHGEPLQDDADAAIRWIDSRAGDKETAVAALQAVLRKVEDHPLHTGEDYSPEELDAIGGDMATINDIAQTVRRALHGTQSNGGSS